MTSRGVRAFLAIRPHLNTSRRGVAGGTGEFREIRATGYAPKYKDEFAKLRSK